MNERDWADRFDRDVERSLRRGWPQDEVSTPMEYRLTLEMARCLAESDFSDESRVRESLQRRLLAQVQGEGQVHQNALERPYFSFGRRTLAGITMLVLCLMLVLGFTYGDTVAAAAQDAYRVLQHIVLGEDATVTQVDSLDELRASPAPEVDVSLLWSVRTDIGNFGGNVFPGMETEVRSLTSLAEAQEQVSFPIRTPAFLPAGYSLREIKLSPPGVPVMAFLFYEGPGREIIIVENPLGIQWKEESEPVVNGDDGTVTITTTVGAAASMLITDETVERLNFNGRPATWVGGYRLDWTEHGVGYTVGGLDLTLDQALRIAASLQ